MADKVDEDGNPIEEGTEKVNLEAPEVKAAITAAVAEATEGLKQNKETILAEKKAIQEKLKAFDGIDPDAIKSMLSERESQAEEVAKKEGKWDEILERKDQKWQKKYDTDVASLSERAERAEAQVNAMVKDIELNAALDSADIAPQYKKAARALVGESVSVEADENGAPAAFCMIDDDRVSVAQYVKAWADSEDGAHYVAAKLNAGGGNNAQAGGNKTVVNPWKKEARNLTEQGRIVKENPTLAARLRKEAGVA